MFRSLAGGSYTAASHTIAVENQRQFSGAAALRQFLLLLAPLLVVAGALAAWRAKQVHLAGIQEAWVGLVEGAGVFATVAVYCIWRKLARLAHCLVTLVVSLICGQVYGALVLTCSRGRSPLVDPALLQIDRALGVDAAEIALWVNQHSALHLFSEVSYASLLVLMLMAMFLPIFFSRSELGYRFVLAFALGVSVACAIVAIWPAVGPWSLQTRYIPTIQQQSFTRSLGILRAPGPAHISTFSDAMITFPSFHVFWSISAAFSLWPLGKFRPVLVFWVAAVCASTLTTGWHYAADCLAGGLLAVAGSSIAIQLIAGRSRT